MSRRRQRCMSPATMTSAGMILGTAAYMAPEQARGKAVDRRADIWAFGCVLFEMLTGRRAFEGDEVTDTLAGILRGEPAWDALPASTPRSIRRLLRRCLRQGSAGAAAGNRRCAARDRRGDVRHAPRRRRPAAPVAGTRSVLSDSCRGRGRTALVVGVADMAVEARAVARGARVTRSLIAVDPFDQRPRGEPGETRGASATPRPDGYGACRPTAARSCSEAMASNINPGGGTQSALFVRSLDSLTATPDRDDDRRGQPVLLSGWRMDRLRGCR